MTYIRHRLRPTALCALLVGFLVAMPEPSGTALADPPRWAPAHGYRAKHKSKHKYKYKRHYKKQNLGYVTAAPVVVPAVGLGNCNRTLIGSLLGGAAGGLLGNQIGSGSGRVAATIGGALLGVLVGHSIGSSMDRIDQGCVSQTLDRAETGRTVAWHNPDNGRDYRVTPTRSYRNAGGTQCREYTTNVIIGGRTETAVGTACRQADGSWQTAN